MLLVILFFQAEDGIRDLVRSRGLGDVYKRQELRTAPSTPSFTSTFKEPGAWLGFWTHYVGGFPPVSYTHLTLPTSDLV